MADLDAPKEEVLRIDDMHMNSDSVEEEDCTFSMDTTDGRGRFTLVYIASPFQTPSNEDSSTERPGLQV